MRLHEVIRGGTIKYFEIEKMSQSQFDELLADRDEPEELPVSYQNEDLSDELMMAFELLDQDLNRSILYALSLDEDDTTLNRVWLSDVSYFKDKNAIIIEVEVEYEARQEDFDEDDERRSVWTSTNKDEKAHFAVVPGRKPKPVSWSMPRKDIELMPLAKLLVGSDLKHLFTVK